MHNLEHRQLDEYLHRKGLRKSFERNRVLDFILDLDAHFTINALYERMKSESPIARSSVYNAVDLFVEASLVVRHPFGVNGAEYEAVSRARNHHHQVCTICGKVHEFTDVKLDKSIRRRQFALFSTSYHSLYLFGICHNCLISSQKKNETTL